MSLLDGRYEVTAQRALGGDLTLFEATAPDGTPLRIEWFDLRPEQEAEFESYRRLLRRLRKDGLAAVHDVIARPGAHYVAWERPPAMGAPAGPTEAGPQLTGALEAAGYSLQACDLRRMPTRPPRAVLYGLTFGAAVAPRQAPPVEVKGATPERPLRQQRPLLQRAKDAIERMPQRTLSWGLGGLLCLVALLVAVAGFWSGRVDVVVSVPPIVGQEAHAAVTALERLGLGATAVPVMSDQPPGTVMAVEPAVGTNLRPGRTVLLRYALPPGELAPTEVPSLVGLNSDGARAALERAGLRLGEVARMHSASPAGTVLAQDLDAGGMIGTGEAVAVLVSLGPQPAMTFLPDLVGLDVATATQLAQVAGVTPDRVFVDQVASGSGSKGAVLEQSLAPYVAVPRDDAVLRLVVQGGEALLPEQGAGVPDVVGLPLAAARDVAAGWDLEVTTLGDPGLPGGVVAQEPQPGAPLPQGAARTLTLTVNAHPIALTTDGVRVVVRQPTLRDVAYAWTIQPGIRTQQGEVWASDLEGNRQLVGPVTVRGGEILRGSWRTLTAGPVTFELLIGGVPYGEPLLVP